MNLRIWNRLKREEETELVYGEPAIKALYQNPFGFFLTDHFLSHPWVSKLYGHYQNSRLSQKKIPAFIKKFQVPMEEFENKQFTSFNDFFIRKFKHGARSFVEEA